jgi:Protein of unknown function (DUF3987)
MHDLYLDRSAGSDRSWPEIDAALLEEKRGPVPAFPIELLPEPWRGWVAETARAAGAPADYVAQSVLGGVAGLCAGASVCILPAWSEPLVLRLAVVGGPASGKSSALAPMHAMLAAIVADEPDVPAVPALVWQDESADWLCDGVAEAPEAWGEVCPPSILGTLRPDEVQRALQASGPGLAARFLYAWPELPPYCPLGERKTPDDEWALNMLRRLHRTIRALGAPLVLGFDEQGLEAFDRFLARLHAQRCAAEGPEAAWLGKGGGTAARLAGVLAVMAWSGASGPAAPGPIGCEAVEAAVGLWEGYFDPHARALFDRAVPTGTDQRVRRVARWLKRSRRTEVSREDIRRDALAQSVTAIETDVVLYRLEEIGVLHRVDIGSSPRGGPRARRWLVNPALSAA